MRREPGLPRTTEKSEVSPRSRGVNDFPTPVDVPTYSLPRGGVSGPHGHSPGSPAAARVVMCGAPPGLDSSSVQPRLGRSENHHAQHTDSRFAPEGDSRGRGRGRHSRDETVGSGARQPLTTETVSVGM